MPEKSYVIAAISVAVIASFVATPAIAFGGLLGGCGVSALLLAGHSYMESKRPPGEPRHGVTQARDEMWTYPDLLRRKQTEPTNA